MNLQKKKVQNY